MKKYGQAYGGGKSLMLGLALLSFVGCAGYQLPDFNYENTETGEKVSMSKDGSVSIDDGKKHKMDFKLNKE